jgi:hypothetical protein
MNGFNTRSTGVAAFAKNSEENQTLNPTRQADWAEAANPSSSLSEESFRALIR